MGHDIFLSHSSKDKTIADAACAVLEQRGLRCWIAPRDIRPSDDWGALAYLRHPRTVRLGIATVTPAAYAFRQVNLTYSIGRG